MDASYKFQKKSFKCQNLTFKWYEDEHNLNSFYKFQIKHNGIRIFIDI